MSKEITAKSNYVRIAPRKARLVIDLVRGQNAYESAQLLKFLNKRAALPVRKTIESAIANAVNNENMVRENLVITEARIDVAPTFKRGRAVSRGRYHQVLKRNSHITIKVAEKKLETVLRQAQDDKAGKESKKAKSTDKKTEKVVKSEALETKASKEPKQQVKKVSKKTTVKK